MRARSEGARVRTMYGDGGVPRLLAAALLLCLLGGPAPASPGGWHHKVRRGETYYRIAGLYYGDPNRWEEIARANPRFRENALPEGAVLFIPRGDPERGPEPVRPVSYRSARGLFAQWAPGEVLREKGGTAFAAGFALYALPIFLFALIFQTLAIWVGAKAARIPGMGFGLALKVSALTGAAYAIFLVFATLLGIAITVVAAPSHAQTFADLQAKALPLLRRPEIEVALLGILPVAYAAIGFRTVQRMTNAAPARAVFVAGATMLAPTLAAAILVRPVLFP